MLNSGYSPWPSFSLDEQKSVAEVLASNRVNYWTGDECRQFEKEFAAWSGVEYAVSLSNGTLALDVALRALGIGPGDEVVVTPRTFIASVSSVVNAGATPVFADVELDSGNISPSTIAPLITEKTRAILPVHIAGWPADMPGIMALAAEHQLSVIEDCAQAHGASINGQMLGSFGDIGAWSFCQDKIMTTGGEGGMVTTNNLAYWEYMWSFKDHGKNWGAVYERSHPPGYRWVHENFGTNWRMLEIQAAIGRIQLKKMSAWRDRRKYIASRYSETLSQFRDAVRVPSVPVGYEHAYYRQYAYVREQGLKSGWDRDRIVKRVLDAGGLIMHGSCSEVYLERAFDDSGFRPATRLPQARELGETSLMLLTHPTLTDPEVEKICSILEQVLSEASK